MVVGLPDACPGLHQPSVRQVKAVAAEAVGEARAQAEALDAQVEAEAPDEVGDGGLADKLTYGRAVVGRHALGQLRDIPAVLQVLL